MEYPVYETDAGGFVGILVGKLDVDFPVAAGEGGWDWSKRLVRPWGFEGKRPTLLGSVKADVEFLPSGSLSKLSLGFGQQSPGTYTE